MAFQNPLPPAGVSRPTVNGDYLPVGRKGSSLEHASGAIAQAEQARVGTYTQDAPEDGGGYSLQQQPPPRRRQRAAGKPAPVPDTVPLKNRRRGAPTPLAEVHSVDGISYTFPKEASGSKNPQAIMADVLRAAIVALAELGKGGDPNTVLEAFGVNIKDVNGQVFYDYRDAPHWAARAAVDSLPPEEDEDEGYEGPDMGDIFAEE